MTPAPDGVSPGHFAFLAEWPDVHDAARRAERLIYADARASSFYARRALELAVDWMYRNDPALTLPYQDHLSALIHEPTFRNAVGPAVFNKADHQRPGQPGGPHDEAGPAVRCPDGGPRAVSRHLLAGAHLRAR